ncbi:MAG: sigma-70 family RNA polymerase sigma factor [Verrucomicrobia bacterium]|nr:sigma-70 family RNA polymerase sigma factor [Verrucomicrobiota bacterium]
MTARQGNTAEAEAALERLCKRYWYPLYAHVRRRGFDPDLAQDLTQEFFHRILKENYLGSADRTKGKFRSFLLAALDHFLLDERKRANAQKRGGGQVIISLDDEDAEGRYQNEPASDTSPEKLFVRQWFLTLYDQVLRQLKDDFEHAGKGRQFEVLKVFLTDDTGFRDYAAPAAELGMTANAVAVAVHRMRDRCRDLMHVEIARTVASPEEMESEIRHLLATLER